MYCSTSIRWHLLRGLAGLGCVGVAVYFGAAHPFAAIVAVVSALFLLRGCPMCWLLGLFDRIRKSAPRVHNLDNVEDMQS